MKTTAICIICLFIFISAEPVLAQLVNADTLPGSAQEGATSKGFTPKKMDIHLQAGTWFSTSSGYGNGWGTFISPEISYSLSPRFRVTGGVSIVNTSFSGYRPYYEFFSGPSYHGDVTSAYLFISGQYLVNDRLTITGSAFKKFNIYESPGLNDPFFKDEPYGASLNVQYRLGRNVYLEGGIGYTNGAVDPYYGNPLYSPVPPLYNPYFPGH